jgi:inosine-uridine nucleoside N-ribohydrolase
MTIGAITNIASAILIEPRITKNIVIVWLGGTAYGWPCNPEFNMAQDIAAARVVFGSGAPFVQLPCMGVVSHLTTTEPELRHHIKGKSKLGDYLYDITCEEVKHYDSGVAWSRVIWDISAVAWLLGENFVGDSLVHAPIPNYDHGYSFDTRRHFMKVAHWINRDAIFADLFGKIAKA